MKPNTHRPSIHAIATIAAVGAAVLLAGFVLTGCGSSKGATPASTTTTTTTTPTTTGTTPSGSASFQAYQSCLQSHGVTLPQGGFGGGNGGGGTPPSGRPSFSAAQQKALAACASLRPTGGFGGGFGPGGGANANNPAFAKFQNCLKRHGVDPTDSAARGSSAFQTALSACRSLLPNGGAGGGPGFGGGTPPAGASGQGNGAAFSQFQACLRSHGVNPAATGGQSQAKTQAALNACRKLLPGGGAGTTSSSTTTTTTR